MYGLSETADRTTFDLFGNIEQRIDLALLGAALYHPPQYTLDPTSLPLLPSRDSIDAVSSPQI